MFWSHGIDCVRFEASNRMGNRRNCFETLPEGSHTETAADFARANPYRKYGTAWRKTAGKLTHRRE